MQLQLENLKNKFNELQKIYWDKNLDPIYWAGEINNPDICFVFMNPTWRNISSNKNWKWLKAPWLWTKNIWKMFNSLWFIDKDLIDKIIKKKASDWDYLFAEEVYRKVKEKSLYITNLSKATQIDSRPLKNEVFRKYLNLFLEEINFIKPKIIITFWNQVSSILLNKNIKVWDYRRKYELLNWIKVFPVYYPVWQWMRNMVKAKEDISWILSTVGLTSYSTDMKLSHSKDCFQNI